MTVLGESGAPHPNPTRARHRGAYAQMLIWSLLSLIASLVLSIEAIALAADPSATFSCDISEKVSCTQVALTWQAHLLGFPNAFLGLVFEPIVITIAVASLGGTRFPRWFMLAAQSLYTIAVAFAYWLFLQAYFVIGALCPWCLLVAAATTLIFVSMLRVNILDGNIRFPGRTGPVVIRWTRLGADTAAAVIVLAIIAAMIVYRYA